MAQVNNQNYLQESVDLIFVLAVDLSFLKERKIRLKSIAWPDAFQPVQDLFSIRSRLLVHELIARESQHGEAALVLASGKLSHQCIQVRVLCCVSSVCRHV